jgi:predicted glutamine amidotransferase
MGAVVAILQNDANLLQCQVRRLSSHVALSEPGRPADAYGYGTYTATEVLLSKRPSGAPAALTLEQLARNVSSEALLAHGRHATVGNLKDENTHPFRFRRWLFAHDGTLEAFPAIRGTLLAELPEFLRRMVAGDTDSEHAFALFLKYLRDGGQLDDLDIDAASAGAALAQAVRRIEELSRAAGAQKTGELNFVATNGRVLVGTRRGRPLHYALLEGILPCPTHELSAPTRDTDPQLAPHRRVKAVCFATHVLQTNGFLEVPEGSLVTVSRSLQVSVTPLGNHGNH